MATRLTQHAPKYTDFLSDNVDIVSITNSSGTVSVVTATDHYLTVGRPVVVTGVSVPIAISSLTRVLGIGTLITTVDHDLTTKIAPSVTITDGADSNFNDTFDVVQIVNRRTIKFSIPDSGPTSTTGANLQSASRFEQGYDGIFAVATVPTSTTFTYASSSNLDGTATTGSIKTNIRVSAAASIERAILSYTEQSVEKAWMFVVLGDVFASKSRQTNTDFVSNQTRSNEYRQQIGEAVSIYVITNTKDEIAGRKVKDEMTTLLRAILRSIGFFVFPTNLYVGNSDPLQFVRHGMYQYDGAVYVHQYDFEVATEVTFDDTVGFDTDVAFRDISMSQDSGLGNQTVPMTSAPNLDDEEYVP